MTPYYKDDYVTLYHGDCREIVPTLGRFDLLLTDPPYGIGALMQGGRKTGHWNTLSSGNAWDMEAPDLSSLLPMAAAAIVWGGNYFDLPPMRGWLAWRKLNAVPTQADMELAWTTLDIPAKMFDHVSGGAMKRHGHPTEKPLELMTWCITLAGEGVKTIFDPFAGSGTTGRAAKDLGRKCVLIEREERYCEIAAKRMRQEVLPLFEPAAPPEKNAENFLFPDLTPPPGAVN
jgi:site-specific DNA-methyltransferase (adenine-specific)